MYFRPTTPSDNKCQVPYVYENWHFRICEILCDILPPDIVLLCAAFALNALNKSSPTSLDNSALSGVVRVSMELIEEVPSAEDAFLNLT